MVIPGCMTSLRWAVAGTAKSFPMLETLEGVQRLDFPGRPGGCWREFSADDVVGRLAVQREALTG